jgi:Uma2 family endonuclease
MVRSPWHGSDSVEEDGRMSMPATTQLLTADEFFDFVMRAENQGKHFELEKGRVVEVSRPGERHGIICANVTTFLNLYVRQRKRGYVLCNDAGIILERDPDTVKGPDVSYFEDSRRYADMNPKLTENVPALAVEVWSPTDRPGKMSRRIQQFFRGGVRMVWILDPEERDVTVHRPGKDEEVFDATQEIVVEDVLPEFRCRVSDFFYVCGDTVA